MNVGDRFISTVTGLKIRILNIVNEKEVEVKCREPNGHNFTQIVFKTTLEGDTFKKIIQTEYGKQKARLKV